MHIERFYILKKIKREVGVMFRLQCYFILKGEVGVTVVLFYFR